MADGLDSMGIVHNPQTRKVNKEREKESSSVPPMFVKTFA